MFTFVLSHWKNEIPFIHYHLLFFSLLLHFTFDFLWVVVPLVLYLFLYIYLVMHLMLLLSWFQEYDGAIFLWNGCNYYDSITQHLWMQYYFLAWQFYLLLKGFTASLSQELFKCRVDALCFPFHAFVCCSFPAWYPAGMFLSTSTVWWLLNRMKFHSFPIILCFRFRPPFPCPIFIVPCCPCPACCVFDPSCFTTIYHTFFTETRNCSWKTKLERDREQIALCSCPFFITFFTLVLPLLISP